MRCARAWGAFEEKLPLPLLAWGFALACAAWRLELARRSFGTLPADAPLGAMPPLEPAYAQAVAMPLWMLVPVLLAAGAAALALLTRWVQRGRRTQTTRWPDRKSVV